MPGPSIASVTGPSIKSAKLGTNQMKSLAVIRFFVEKKSWISKYELLVVRVAKLTEVMIPAKLECSRISG